MIKKKLLMCLKTRDFKKRLGIQVLQGRQSLPIKMMMERCQRIWIFVEAKFEGLIENINGLICF